MAIFFEFFFFESGHSLDTLIVFEDDLSIFRQDNNSSRMVLFKDSNF